MKKSILVALSLIAAFVVLGGCTGPKDLIDDAVPEAATQ